MTSSGAITVKGIGFFGSWDRRAVYPGTYIACITTVFIHLKALAQRVYDLY